MNLWNIPQVGEVDEVKTRQLRLAKMIEGNYNEEEEMENAKAETASYQAERRLKSTGCPFGWWRVGVRATLSSQGNLRGVRIWLHLFIAFSGWLESTFQCRQPQPQLSG